MRLHVGIVGADLLEYLVPEDHRVVERVAFRDRRQRLLLLAREFVGVADDALGSLAREDAVLDDDLFGRVLVQPRARTGVFALRVLADERHVDVLGLDADERTRRAGQELHRAHVHVLVETMADFEQQFPEGDVVRHAGESDRAEEDRVELRKRLQSVFGHHAARLQVVFASPWEMGEGKAERAVETCGALQDPFAFGNDLRANAVSGDDGDSVFLHGHLHSAGSFAVCQGLGAISHCFHAAHSTIHAPVRARG